MVQTARKKAAGSAMYLLLLGLMAGAFIAFAAEGSNMAAHSLLAHPETYGLGKCLAGAIFGTGLMMVVVAGAELFTGNTMMIMGVMSKEISWSAMLRNWLLVYAGNFAGSAALAWAMNYSGLLGSGGGLLGGMTVKIALGKVHLSFGQALVLGILCNILVCAAVWMAAGAKDITGKI
ncbi:MAG: formate/nitrite transporter family protein, partial [Gracilibacteraceae bacterium]|nr:formate/nitrite transporter family protein [Gracilibacteraceae bacterium]